MGDRNGAGVHVVGFCSSRAPAPPPSQPHHHTVTGSPSSVLKKSCEKSGQTAGKYSMVGLSTEWTPDGKTQRDEGKMNQTKCIVIR